MAECGNKKDTNVENSRKMFSLVPTMVGFGICTLVGFSAPNCKALFPFPCISSADVEGRARQRKHKFSGEPAKGWGNRVEGLVSVVNFDKCWQFVSRPVWISWMHLHVLYLSHLGQLLSHQGQKKKNWYRMLFVQNSTLPPSIQNNHPNIEGVVCKTTNSQPEGILNQRIALFPYV